MMDNARSPRITAAAGTRLAGASSLGTVILLPNERVLQPIRVSYVRIFLRLPHSRNITGSSFR